MKHIVCSIAVLLSFCCNVHSQSCGTSSYRGSTYSAPSYSQYQSHSYSVAPTYYKEEYKPQGYFTRLVAFFPVLDVPTYGASVYMQPPGPGTAAVPATAPAPVPASDVAKVLEALKIVNKGIELIDQRITRLEGTAPQPQKQQQQQPQQQPQQQTAGTAQQIVAAKCAICHNQEKAATWGSGFTMVDAQGKLEKLSDKAVKKVVKHCMANTMPPAEADRKGDLAEKLKGFTGKLPDRLTDAEASALIAFYSGATRNERLEIAETRSQPRRVVRR